MRHRHLRTIAASAAALGLVIAACGGDDDDAGGSEATGETAAETVPDDEPSETEAPDEASDTEAPDDTGDGGASSGECDEPMSVSLQLQWFTQAQFGGYFAAQDQGFYEDHCLDVEILEGGVDIVPQQVLADGGADFAIAWVPKALQTREEGAEIVNIAQIFQRSGTLQVSFADSGITSPADFEGKRIGNWGFGNEYEVFAALTEAGLDPASDVELVQQDFDMRALLEGDIDAAEAMTYNEYAQVLEADNPDTGELYQPEDFNVISYEEEGVGMLQDAIWADETRLADDEEYRDAAVRFVAASIEGWAYCRDNAQECADIVLAAGSQLGASHQLWMMNETNQLVWPAENGIGYIDEEAWNRTVEISLGTQNLEGATVLSEEPAEGAFTNDIVNEAWELLGDGVDTEGADYEPIEVTLEPGGE